jgi:hypothetical protein
VQPAHFVVSVQDTQGHFGHAIRWTRMGKRDRKQFRGKLLFLFFFFSPRKKKKTNVSKMR